MSPTPRPPFEAVVATHGATVLRVCRAVLGSRHAHEVDDAWSETFLSALRAWPDLPGDANVEAWLVTIAHRKAVDVTRAAGRRAVPVAQPTGSASDGAGSDAHATELDLVAAVAALPRRQREALAYHHLAGLPYADVAVLVGSRPDAVRRAASDALAALRRNHPNLARDLPKEPS